MSDSSPEPGIRPPHPPARRPLDPAPHQPQGPPSQVRGLHGRQLLGTPIVVFGTVERLVDPKAFHSIWLGELSSELEAVKAQLAPLGRDA